MNFSAPFIKRPVMTTLLMAALLLFGILGYLSLPVSDLPDVDYPTIRVTANLAGASPETMAATVAQPLENAFTSIPGVVAMTSSSQLGYARIVLQFDFSRNIDNAAQDVQAAISQTQKQLPKQMLTAPSYKKMNPAAAAVMYYALSSDTVPMITVNQYADEGLSKTLTMINGVSEVDLYGENKYAVRIQVNPELLAKYHLSFDQIIKTVQDNNVSLPTGVLKSEQQEKPIYVPGQLLKAKDYRSLIIEYKNGNSMRLGDVADVLDSVENLEGGSWVGQKPAIMIEIHREPGLNTLEVIERIKESVKSFAKKLPPNIHLSLLYDRSDSIKASVHEVQSNLIIACLLVILVIFLFLKNLSATIIPATVLPITIVGTFAFMALLHFSLDNISLLGLTLAVGFFVDDAIVMLENILQHLEQGKDCFQAALDGSKEINFTIISMTLALLAAFIPIVFMPGLIGRLLNEFSITLLIAISISALISLTLTPMMASRMLKITTVKSGFLHQFDVQFDRLFRAYQKGLTYCLAWPKTSLLLWFSSLLLTLILLIFVKKDFIPSENIGYFNCNTQAALGTSFNEMVEMQKKIIGVIQHDPAVSKVNSFLYNANSGSIFIRLNDDFKGNWHDTLTRLRLKTSAIPGIKTYIRAPAALNIGGVKSKSEYQLSVQGTNLKDLYYFSDILYRKLLLMPSLTDVALDDQLDNPQINFEVNRDKAASLHVSMYNIQNTLLNATGSPQISTIYTQNNQYSVILEVQPQFQKSIPMLQQLYVSSDDGNLISLAALGEFKEAVGPEVINHDEQIPAVTLSFALKSGFSLSDAMKEINHVVYELKFPAGLSYKFTGSAQAFQDSLKSFLWLIILAIAVIYILLGILYESFIHPLTIISSIPTAGVGALLLLILTGYSLDLYAFIGLLMLIGIVKKNAIIMIDFAIVKQRQGIPAEKAIFEACLRRFRPIMMTTFAAFMGCLPIVFASGMGSEARRSLGLTVAGGLLTSQLLTLFSTPIIYLYFEKLKKYLGSLKREQS